MALRWFVRATTTQIVGQPSERRGDGVHASGCLDEGGKTSINMVIRYQEEGSKAQGDVVEAQKARNGRSGRGVGECSSGFQMPLHYPRYKKEDYEEMEEWKVDMLLREYGLSFDGSLEEKRAYAMGTFLWPDQL